MKKVLVIDDEEPLREVVREALKSDGYDVIEADNAPTGLELARTHLPTLILCDVHMEPMDGYAFVEKLRQESLLAPIPVILITGIQKDYSSVRKAMGIGADDYLLKPFSIGELLEAVHVRLAKQQMIVNQAESRLSELRASIALSLPHELRTPLVSILGFAALLKAYGETMDRKEIGQMATDIHNSATRLHDLIENFLIFAQIELLRADEARLKGLRRAVTDNLATVITIVAQQRGDAHDRMDELKLSIAEKSVAISTEYLEKILSSLIDNAFKFSESGSGVEVECVDEGGFAVVKIRDHGRGMSADQVASVGGYMQFERKMYEQQGSGLGLIIAKRLLEIHGGGLDIESTQGSGTTVTAKIPLAAKSGI